MREYDAVIIGAGVAGLACGLKLSAAGKKIILLEKQPVPGGFATTFSRKGFTFESSLHCVDALAEGGEIREFLKEHGVGSDADFIELGDFGRIIYPEHDFIADFNKDNFVKFLKESFPDERIGLDRLFKEFDKFYSQFDAFCDSKLPDWLNLILGLLLYRKVIKASCISAKQLIAGFIKDEKLQGIICDIWRFIGVAPERLSALYFLIVFRGYFYNKTAYHKGGFMGLFKEIAHKISKNGSETRFNASVKSIIVDNNAVVGVITDKGEEIKARAVISNANAVSTLTGLLDNNELKNSFHKKLSMLEKSVSAFQVYLGLDVPASQLGMQQARMSINTSYSHESNLAFSLNGDYDSCLLEVTDHSQIDPGLVPAGKGSLIAMTYDSYGRWEGMDKDEYEKRKHEVANKIIQRLEKYLPGISKHIEVMEAATPITMQSFGSSLEGAIYGFAQTVEQSGINRLRQETPVKGLFLAGAWTQPGGGVHGCFVSGIDAAEIVLSFLRRRISCCSR